MFRNRYLVYFFRRNVLGLIFLVMTILSALFIFVFSVFVAPSTILDSGRLRNVNTVTTSVAQRSSTYVDLIECDGNRDEFRSANTALQNMFSGLGIARLKRKEWKSNLSLIIESEHGGFPVSDNREQEYPYGHFRFNLLGPIGPTCLNLEKYGSGDGEKRACGLSFLTSNLTKCIIISLGSSNQWDFEQSIYDRLPHCNIETFDCTIPPDISPPLSISDRTRLHHICIGSSDFVGPNNQIFRSWTSMLRIINATQQPAYLKMDIEGFEYQVLRSMVHQKHLLPIQIAFELHYETQMDLSWRGRRKSSAELAIFMEYLRDEGNYYLIDRHDNPYCKHCSELLITRFNDF